MIVVLLTALWKTVIAELVAAELFHRYPSCRVLMNDANEAPRSTAQGVHPEAPEAGEGRGGNCDRGDIREVDGLGQSQGQGDNSDALACAEREDRDTDS
jgi:hypothetical protein